MLRGLFGYWYRKFSMGGWFIIKNDMQLEKRLKKAFRYAMYPVKQLDTQIQVRQFHRNLQRFHRPYRLHVGCGKVKLENWINMDARPLPDSVDIRWDIRKKMPIADSTCEFIYTEHLLEHLTVREGTFLLAEFYRLLQPLGVVRIAMPSLDYIVRKYISPDWNHQDWLTWEEYRHIRTRGEMINIAFRSWGHKWLYDAEELRRRLTDAGFSVIRDCAWGESEHPLLRKLESRPDSILICEASKS